MSLYVKIQKAIEEEMIAREAQKDAQRQGIYVVRESGAATNEVMSAVYQAIEKHFETL